MSESKTADFHIRTTHEEKEMIQAKAKQANMSMSRFIVATAQEKKIFDLSDLPKYIAQIGKVGNNINQIAVVANSTGTVKQEEIQRLQSYLQELTMSATQILKFIYGQEETPAVDIDGEYQKLRRDMKELNTKLNLLIDYVTKDK